MVTLDCGGNMKHLKEIVAATALVAVAASLARFGVHGAHDWLNFTW
jgi:hypothetical protein